MDLEVETSRRDFFGIRGRGGGNTADGTQEAEDSRCRGERRAVVLAVHWVSLRLDGPADSFERSALMK